MFQRGIQRLELDGVAQDRLEIALADDGKRHEVRVVMRGLSTTPA